MARLSTVNTPAPLPDPTAINLNRMIERLQSTIINPDSKTETRLRTSGLERGRVGYNLQHAEGLLVRLEQEAASMKVQGKKQEIQAELSRKREILQRLRERLEELNELGNYETEEDDTSEGEDILGEDTPGEETDTSHADPVSETPSPTNFTPPPISPAFQAPPPIPEPAPAQSTRAAEEPSTSTLRARTQNARSELLHPSSTTTGTSHSLSTQTQETLLSHNRLEQETLTNSLLSMASALKESSRAFATSLEEEKSVLDSATKGLDKNELGLEAASRKMGYLRTMTEGRGWWGRMLMYVWIFGLMVVAVMVVFVMPKLRF